MFQETIRKRAQHSVFFRWLLNLLLFRMIPFNRPHRFTVHRISEWSVTTRLPYRRVNHNHIRGLHACALATITEFTSGLVLISHLEPGKFRIILKRLEMDYSYQGKMDAFGTFTISPEWLEDNVLTPLKSAPAVVVPCTVEIRDRDNNLLTTGVCHWQVKSWSQVRTRA